MWTRSAQNRETGKFTVACTDWNGAEFFRGEFADGQEANRAGEDAERRMTLAMQAPALEPIPDDIAAMSNEELLAELLA
jgi:hypothetical protein